MIDREVRDSTIRSGVIENPWSALRQFTTARIALGRSGVSQPTSHQLAFQLAHAQARDAVHSELDVDHLTRGLDEQGLASVVAHSAASDRQTFLLRPDLGRRLDTESIEQISRITRHGVRGYDIAFVIADGLSATAIERHAVALLDVAVPAFVARGWSIAPVTIVRQGRVAIGDEIGALLGAEICAVLIGERPGLSAPDSLGIYLTYDPRLERTDADRNCISNVRAAGLSYHEAAATLLYLADEARSRKLSGVALKNDAPAGTSLHEPTSRLPDFG